MMEITGLTYQSKISSIVDYDFQCTGAVRAGLIVALLFSVLNEYFGFDRKLADLIYLAGNHSWALQKNYWLQKIIHNAGRNVSIFLELTVLTLYFGSFYFRKIKKFRQVLLYLFLSVLVSTSLISIGKHTLSLSCPWEFSIYGGQLNYLSRISQLWVANGEGCFPAGHSSAGYSWICLFFAGIYLKNRWSWFGLVIPLIVGFVFGFAQQLRGAHFLSDDIWTLTICWITAVLLYRKLLVSDLKNINHNPLITH
jgi:membrane-associated PAP2 superfamily phosphatase